MFAMRRMPMRSFRDSFQKHLAVKSGIRLAPADAIRIASVVPTIPGSFGQRLATTKE